MVGVVWDRADGGVCSEHGEEEEGGCGARGGKGVKLHARGVLCTGGVMGVSHGWHLCGAVCVQCEEVWVCWGCDGCVMGGTCAGLCV